MSNLYEIRELRWYTTPDQLRVLADRLEMMMRETLVGQNVPALTVDESPGRRLVLTIDQDRWREDQKPGGNS